MFLTDLKIKDQAVITGFQQGNSLLQERLMELGIVPGTRVLLKRFAPLGDPLEIIVRGYSLAIRKEDARQILVSPVIAV
ncbi:MAG TPA: FeoA family protein [Candidatus Omnitrophota bacterium]|nr:FeoA family protein [Candidatus Omnitrophota bacterium]